MKYVPVIPNVSTKLAITNTCGFCALSQELVVGTLTCRRAKSLFIQPVRTQRYATSAQGSFGDASDRNSC
jgi:hypothetical protein